MAAGAIVVLIRLLETFMIYPAPVYPDGDWSPDLPYEDVYLTSADGTKLHGWLLPYPNSDRWILYCHGNGTNVAYSAESLTELSQSLRASVFVFDYRGYGRSDGRPDEAGVLADGAAAYEWLSNRSGQEFDCLWLMGRSLGGAVALDLAVRYGTRGLILERTFTRMTDVAADRFPFFPVRTVMRNRYDNMQKIGQFRGPLLLSHGTADSLIPFRHARELFDACISPAKVFFAIDGGNHNSPSPPEYERALQEFVGIESDTE